MARKRQAEVTPESVDDMTDEEVTALMEGQDEAPAENEDADDKDATDDTKTDSDGDEADAADQADEGDGDDKPNDGEQDEGRTETVDFKRYDYERNRRREAEKARDAEKAEWSRRFDELLKRQQPAAQEQERGPVVPDADDPLGRINYMFDRMQRQEQETAEQRQQREQAEQQQNYVRQVIGEAVVEFQGAAQADPTLAEAYDAVKQSFEGELRLYRTPPHEMQARLNDLEAQHILFAKQNGIPVDEYIRNLATSRGWQPRPAQQEKAKDEGGADEAAKEQGRKRSKSLSNGGGSPGVSDALTPQQILDMSPAEFDAFMEKEGSVSEYLERVS